MKKLLSILASFAMISTSVGTVISCEKPSEHKEPPIVQKFMDLNSTDTEIDIVAGEYSMRDWNEQLVIDSFNVFNGSSLILNEDVKLETINKEADGKGSVKITALPNTVNAKGETTLNINKEFDITKAFNNFELGEILMPEDVYNNFTELFNKPKSESESESDFTPYISWIMQYVGDKNKVLGILREQMVSGMMTLLEKDQIVSNQEWLSFQSQDLADALVSRLPNVSATPKELKFKFTLKKGDVHSVTDGITDWDTDKGNPQIATNPIIINKSDIIKDQRQALSSVYKKLKEKFTNSVNEQTFLKYARFNPTDFKFNILPGSNDIFGVDPSAYLMFFEMVNKFSPEKQRQISPVSISSVVKVFDDITPEN